MWRAAARYFKSELLHCGGSRSRIAQVDLYALAQHRLLCSATAEVQTVDRLCGSSSDHIFSPDSSILSQLNTPLEDILDAALLGVVSRYDNRDYFRSLNPYRSAVFSSTAEPAEYIGYGDPYEGTEVDYDERGIEFFMSEHAGAAVEAKEMERKKGHNKLQELRQRQIINETEAWTNAEAQYEEFIAEMCRKKLAPNLPASQLLLLGWYEPLRDAIAEEQRAFSELEFRGERASYGPFLCQLPPSQLAVITMHCLLALVMSNEKMGYVKVIQAALHIGEAVEQEVLIRKLRIGKAKKNETKRKGITKDDGISTIESGKVELTTSPELPTQATGMQKLRKLRLWRSMLQKASGSDPWGPTIYAKVGSRLLELFMETAVIRVPSDDPHVDASFEPVFQHTNKKFVCTSGRSSTGFGVVECNPLVLEQIDKSVKYVIMPYMPMVSKPKHWKGFHDGGYLFLKSSIMRTHGSKEQYDIFKNTPRENMKKIFQALNVLGETGWRVNKPVLAVLEQIWKEGGRLANLVDAEDVLVPAKPETNNLDELKSWRREVGIVKRTNYERYSLRCDVELKLAVARKLVNEDAFYLPHNLDFRGRAYPMHPNLNHLGSDMCRGVLEFAKGRPLGETGLRWLKIHLANLYGGSISKLSFDARVAHVDTHMDDVFDSAENPMNGNRWWLKAEDPFQFLAACIDIRNAVKSGNPKTYNSFLPVHQDGSCNGLQHYAALGRDRIGAGTVNLLAGDVPADVYSAIADRVHRTIEKAALKNPEASKHAAIARVLLGQIDRKLVKQTIMTSVYGVTFVGARIQILNRLKERGIIQDGGELFKASVYAAKVTLDALGEGFREARCIMNWLSECAQIIAHSGNSVKWTTPLGLEVVQPYRNPSRHLVKTALQDLHIRSVDVDSPVLKTRQRSAFAPNFIHSLDSTHMMLTALASNQAGISFAGVHDSFWTHAGDVDVLNKLTREKFVELYSYPILENLLLGFQRRYADLTFPPVPERGVLDIREVLKAPYFFN
uniref:DNA-directed RNA polymerase n=1 Tax=Physcomitrium patens TaxID=3218 RepID=N1LJC9_PHYPA|nr:DNA-dependent RNA polymerase [Physcomitrium patens]